jgi:uncharacterized protein
MFYFGLENDHFIQTLTRLDFDASEPYFDERLFGANPRLNLLPVEIIEYGRKVLALEKHTGSWCFLDPLELQAFRSLDGTALRDVAAGFPDGQAAELREFVAHLYWRGLLRINGRRFIEPDVFSPGPISRSGGLFVIVPTERCNLACKYCAVKSDPWRQERMTWATAQRSMDLIIDYISQSGTVEFVGGEAFLEMDLIEQIVDYGKQNAEKIGKHLKFGAQSNGTLIKKDLLERIKAREIGVGISLDGDQVSNDMARVFPGNKGTYTAITRTIALMRESDCAPGVICVVSKANYWRIDKVLADYAQLDQTGIKLNPVSCHGRARQEWDALALEPEEFLEAHIKYLDLVVNEGCTVHDENTTIMVHILGTKMHPYRCMRSQCGAGRDFMTFAPNGDIYPCPQTRVNPEFRLANVLEVDRLNDIWKNNPIMSKLAERQAGSISECKECTYKRFCEAGCPISSYEHFGSADAVHPWCRYYKGIYSEIFRILSEGPHLTEIFCPKAKVFDKSFLSEHTA